MARDANVTFEEAFPGLTPPASSSEDAINDQDFICSVNRLKELRAFLNQEAIPVTPDNSDHLPVADLYRLRYSDTGRAPKQNEWASVEFHLQKLFGLLSAPLRKRFLVGEIPLWLSWLPIALAFAAIVALILAATFPNGLGGTRLFPYYLFWVASLGALGAIAFIGMNALSVQHDLTFDICNRRLMVLRITLGALFGLIFTLPFGFPWFVQFIEAANWADLNAGDRKAGLAALQELQNIPKEGALLLLLPFVLGFSTSLVITILNKLIDAVQAFFGRTEGTEANPSAPMPTGPSST
jgi:hypothetical protein